MSKKRKKKRSRRPNIPAAMMEKPTKKRVRLTESKAFDPDYSYVISDLRRIGVLAASFIGLLIILSFLMR